jgi:flagellar M-ring protein FliF
MTGSASAAGGATGVTANLPAVANTGTGGGGSGSKYNSKTSNITYGVGKTVTHSVIAPGNVNQQHVSVLVDKSVPAAQLPALKAAVANAVGLVAKRGDTISFGQIAFSKTAAGTTAAAANPMSKMMGYAKYAIFGILGIVFLFLMSRMVRRREREDFGGNATWLRELSDPRPLAALEGGEGQTQVMQLQSPANPAKRQIEDLVERDPDRVAQQVRAWMNED